jgi:hypothetical protein
VNEAGKSKLAIGMRYEQSLGSTARFDENSQSAKKFVIESLAKCVI